MPHVGKVFRQYHEARSFTGCLSNMTLDFQEICIDIGTGRHLDGCCFYNCWHIRIDGFVDISE
jgi:hypothetical protein